MSEGSGYHGVNFRSSPQEPPGALRAPAEKDEGLGGAGVGVGVTVGSGSAAQTGFSSVH